MKAVLTFSGKNILNIKSENDKVDTSSLEKDKPNDLRFSNLTEEEINIVEGTFKKKDEATVSALFLPGKIFTTHSPE